VLSGAGTLIQAGEISDLDPNSKTAGRNWYGDPQTMGQAQKMERDADVRTAKYTLTNPLITCEWGIEAASKQPIDLEIADFVHWNLFECNPWRAVLRQSLNYVRDGSSFQEVTDDVVDISATRFPNHPGKGKGVAITGFHEIPMWSIDAFNQHSDDTRTLDSVIQWIQGSDQEKPRYQEVNADRILRLTWEQNGADFTGFAPLRSAWGPWKIKQLLVVIDAMAHERHHLGVPTVTLEGDVSKDDLNVIKKVLRQMRAHEQGYAIFPHGIVFKWETVNGAQLTNIAEALWRCKFEIAHNFSAGFMLLGAKQVGAFNTAATQSGQHHFDIKAHAGFVEDGFNVGQDGWSPIERIVRLNYGERVDPPKGLRARNLPTEDWAKILPVVHNLTTSRHITPDERTEDHLRRVLKLPPSDPATRRAFSGEAEPMDLEPEKETTDDSEKEEANA